MSDIRPTTLTVIERDGKILLGLKKRGFAEGVWNGFGGKVMPGETEEAAMVRELFEESGLKALEYEKIGYLEFRLSDEADRIVVNIYRVHKFLGEPIETEEMVPKWFPLDGIPYELMWPDDPHWLPLALEGKKFQGHFEIENKQTITDYRIEIVDGIL